MTVVQLHLTEYDDNAWLWVPHIWPHGDHPDAATWADAVSREIAERPGSYKRGRKPLRKDLIALAAGESGETSRWTIAYVPEIIAGQAALVARVKVSDVDGPYASLEEFMQLDPEGLIAPPTIEPFTSEHLGEGIKTAKRKAMPNRSIAAVHAYGWEYEGVYVSLYLAGLDLGRMLAIDPAFDGLARTMSLTVTRDGASDA